MLKVYTGTQEEPIAYLRLDNSIHDYAKLNLVDIDGQELATIGRFSSDGLILDSIDFYIAKKYHIPTDKNDRLIIARR